MSLCDFAGSSGYLTLRQAARAIDASSKTIDYWIKTARLFATRAVGGGWRIHIEDLMCAAEECGYRDCTVDGARRESKDEHLPLLMGSTCGDFGGLTRSGSPCRARSGGGRCHLHGGSVAERRKPQYGKRKKRRRQDQFLGALSEHGTTRKALAILGMSKNTHRYWLTTDAEYRAMYEKTMRDL